MTTSDPLFEVLRAKAAAANLELLRTDPQDGPQRYFLVKRTTVRELRSICDVEALLAHLNQGR